MWKMSQSCLSEGEMIFIVSLKLTSKFADAEQHIKELILYLGRNDIGKQSKQGKAALWHSKTSLMGSG